MSTLSIIDTIICICSTYLICLFRRKRYRLLLPSSIHTFTWLAVAVLIRLTMMGVIGTYYGDTNDELSYEHVAPFILGIIISSICGFTLAQLISNNKNSNSECTQLNSVVRTLHRYRWVLFICFAVGLIQGYFIYSLAGFENLGDYRMAAVTLKRTGLGALSQQISGHITILGSLYIALLGYKHAHTKISVKEFLIDAILLSSTNIAIAGRGWILTTTLPYFITYLWQKNKNNFKGFKIEIKKILIILVTFVSTFSIIGMIRNNNENYEDKNSVDKYLYYTDGSRVTNYTLVRFPEDSFEKEYGQCEFLAKWYPSKNLQKYKEFKGENTSLEVTVSSALPFLYFDFGFSGGIIMWGVFCFIIEMIAIHFRYSKSIFGIFIFVTTSNLLFQAPIGDIFNMLIPTLEWLIILYIFRRQLKLE